MMSGYAQRGPSQDSSHSSIFKRIKGALMCAAWVLQI
jgi:hypothetical protein